MAEKKITYDDYRDIIINKAVEAAKARADYNKEIWGEQWSKNIDEDILKYANQYREALFKKKPYKDITEKELSDIAEFPADSMMQWVDGNFRGDSPWDVEKKVEASKILPLLLGEAKEGKDWYSRTPLDLRGIGKKEFGYDTSTPEGFQGFLNKLGESQQQYDRAKMLKEGQQGADYWVSKLLFPSYTQEIENAVLTGQGGDNSTLKKLKAIDVLANSAQFVAPSVVVPKANPLLMGSLDAIIGQGGAEVARQYAKQAASTTGQEADLEDAVLAASLGATRPGMATMAAGAVNQLPTKFAKDVARGFQRGARTGAGDERVAIEQAVNLYNKDLAGKRFGGSIEVDGSNYGNGFLIDVSGHKYDEAVKVPSMAKLFGIKPDANGKFSAKKILDYYDADVRAPKIVNADTKGEVSLDLAPSTILPKAEDFNRTRLQKALGLRKPETWLGSDKYSQFRTLFPEKSAEIDVNKAAYLLGRIGGNAIAEVGSRTEPIAKGNPLKLVNENGVQKSYTERYKDQPWFKQLDDESKKILEEVLKAKSEK